MKKYLKLTNPELWELAFRLRTTATNPWKLASVTCGRFRWFANRTIDRPVQL